MSRFTLRVLSGFELRIGSGPPLVLPTRKAQALLAYLALTPGRAHPRDKLTALLWPETGDRRARHSLRQALFSLRKALPAGPSDEEIVVEGDHVALNPGAVDVDAITFERRVREGTLAALGQAIDLYRGDLLEGLAFREPAFEEWLVPERERLRELALEALAKLAGLYERGGNLGAGIEATQRLVALDPLQEVAHRMLMRLYARDGRRGAALRQYQSCLSVLKRDLGAEPEAETRQLYHELLRQRSTGTRVHALPPSERSPDRDAALAPRGRGRGDTPLIGRDAELGRLRQSLARARQGQGVVAAVIGEAGVGKSRLLRDFLAEAVGGDTRVLIGRAYEMEGALPLGPWADALRGGLGPALQDLEDFSPVWKAHLRQLLPDLWPEPPVAPGDGVPRLFEAIAELLRHLASRRPVLVALEDVHWADGMSLNLLSFVARRISGWPVMVVATARDEELTASATQILRTLDVAERVVSVLVGRLSRPATLTLVRALGRSGRRPVTARLGSRIWALSEGNPFMVVETMQVVDEVGRARIAGRLPLPDRIRKTIIGRLERLSERGQRLAAAAAVIGREFEFPLLQRSSGLGERQTAERMEELVRRGVLRASGEQFEFTHDSIRKVAYEQLLAPRRDALHLAVARSLEALYAEHLEDVHDRLAYHYSRTRHAAKAVAYLTRSAEGASRRHAAADALRSLEQALTHADRLPASERDRARLDVSLRLAVALSILGRFDEILKRLAPLGALVERLDDSSVAGAYHARLALTHSNVGAHDEARRSAHRAIDAAMRSGDDVTRGQAHYVLSIESFLGGRAVEGLADGRQAVELLERAGERRWVGQAHWIVGLNHLLLGDFECALRAAGQAESLGTTLGDQELEGFAATVVAWIHVIRGAWTEAMETARRSLRRSPDPANKATALGLAAMAELASGPVDGDRLAKALRVLEQSVQQLSRFGFRQSVMLIYLAEAHLLGGDTKRAEGLGVRGLALAGDRGFVWGVAAAERLLGRIARARGALLDARRHLEQALEIFAGVPARFEVALTQLNLAAIAHAQGRAEDACAYLDDAIPALRNQGAPRALQAGERLLEAIRPPLERW